ncbi:MAG: hypothetical protein ACHQZS_00210 [Candidatus Binatales bacterium]
MQRIQLPRMSRREVEDLMRAHVCLATVDGMLRDSKWAAAPAAIALIGQADEVIARIYNKVDASVRRQASEETPETGQHAPSESAPQVSTAEPEIGAPAKGDA